MNESYKELIKNRFLNTVFLIRKSTFLEKFNIDNSLGGEGCPGYILTHKIKESSLVICVKKINTEYLVAGSEGYVVSISQKENDDIICSKTMWFYSNSLIGNKQLIGDYNESLFGSDIISIMRMTMDALEFKFNNKNTINDKDNEEYMKYENMFDICDKLGRVY